MVVVVVEQGLELRGAWAFDLVGPRVGPLPLKRQVEPLDLAVGRRPVGPGLGETPASVRMRASARER